MNTKKQNTTAANTQPSLFSDIEKRANDLALNGNKHPFKWHKNIEGLLSPKSVEATRQSLKKLDVDDYVSKVLDPAESTSRPNAKAVISQIRGKIHSEFELGPLYSCLLYTSPSPRDQRGSRMPSSA